MWFILQRKKHCFSFHSSNGFDQLSICLSSLQSLHSSFSPVTIRLHLAHWPLFILIIQYSHLQDGFHIGWVAVSSRSVRSLFISSSTVKLPKEHLRNSFGCDSSSFQSTIQATIGISARLFLPIERTFSVFDFCWRNGRNRSGWNTRRNCKLIEYILHRVNNIMNSTAYSSMISSGSIEIFPFFIIEFDSRKTKKEQTIDTNTQVGHLLCSDQHFSSLVIRLNRLLEGRSVFLQWSMTSLWNVHLSNDMNSKIIVFFSLASAVPVSTIEMTEQTKKLADLLNELYAFEKDEKFVIFLLPQSNLCINSMCIPNISQSSYWKSFSTSCSLFGQTLWNRRNFEEGRDEWERREKRDNWCKLIHDQEWMNILDRRRLVNLEELWVE